MSDYYKKLDSVAKTRYLEKLKLLGLDEMDDPYDPVNSHNFVDDMIRWPPVEYGNIFCYYIQRPGVYTKQQLLQWKSLDVFNYFQSGHVRHIYQDLASLYYLQLLHCEGICKPKAKCTRKSSPCMGWHYKLDGEVITLHCTCMAG